MVQIIIFEDFCDSRVIPSQECTIWGKFEDLVTYFQFAPVKVLFSRLSTVFTGLYSGEKPDFRQNL